MNPLTGMDPRAAKALAACFADLIEAKIQIINISDAQMAGGSGLCDARVKAVRAAQKAQDQIVAWLQQPMTTAHLTPRGREIVRDDGRVKVPASWRTM